MNAKEFQTLKVGDKVIFQRSGNSLNGKIVEVKQKLAEQGSIIVPRPDYDDILCAFPYATLKVVR